MALTTAERVRNKFPFSGPPDYVIDQFIEDAQAWVEAYVGRTITSSDNYYNLARSLCTHRALIFLILRKLEEATEEERDVLLRVLDETQAIIAEEKTALKRA